MQHLLAQVESEQPDCLILDWELPGEPLRERIKLVRSLASAMKIIVTSARPEARFEARLQGADAFAEKSESPLQILEIMRECCEEEVKP